MVWNELIFMKNIDQKKHQRPVRPTALQILRSLVGAFIGIGAVAVLEQFFLDDTDVTLVIGAFGATAVLVFGTPSSPLAQPYNVVVGHLVSAMVGVVIFQIIGEANWLSASLAVALAIVAMQITNSVHPPGGASALIAVVSSPEIHNLGFLYVVYPVGVGAIILIAVACVSNNLYNNQRWPVFWL